MRLALCLCLCLAAVPAAVPAAADGLKPSDTVLDRAGMDALLTGQTVEFHDGSKSRYGSDGRYGYTYTDDGPVWAGVYTLHEDSRVCVAFDNGSQRCDRFVRNGERVVLITEDGTRFPVRNLSVYNE